MTINNKRAIQPFALFFTLGMMTASLSLNAAEWDNELSLEARIFTQNALRSNQEDFDYSVAFESEFYHDWDADNQRFAVTPFLRWDAEDSERTHFDLRELYWRKTFDESDLDLTIGLSKVFWGVTESVHLVDIINQTDFVENLDGEDKLGQPMINFTWTKDWGIIDAFILPYFRERTFADFSGRPSLPLPVDTDNPLYASGSEEKHVDWAIRYSQVFGDWDVGLAHFQGTSRDPYLLPRITTNGGTLVPFYDQISQTSIDVQATLENWLWKLEAITNDSEQFDRYFASAVGFEYSFYDLRESGIDFGFISEYLFDDRQEYSLSPFQNDIFVGGRFAFNDENSTELLMGGFYDLDNSSKSFSVEGSRRLGQDMQISLEGRFFAISDQSDSFFSLRNDDHFMLTFTKYF